MLVVAAISMAVGATQDSKAYHLNAHVVSQTFDFVTEVNALRARGEIARARAVLAREIASHSEARKTRARALLARMDIAQGDVSRGIAALESSLQTSERLALIPEAVSDAFALSFHYMHTLHDLPRAERVLSHAKRLSQNYPKVKVEASYYSALLALKVSDLRGALRELRAAIDGAERLGLHELGRAAVQQRALTLASLGRFQPALRDQASVIGTTPVRLVCERASAHGNLAWIAYQAHAAGLREALPDISTELERARDLFLRCGDRTRSFNATLNRSLWALRLGQTAKAERELSELRSEVAIRDPNLRLWKLEVEARLLQSHGNYELAAQRFQREVELSEAAGNTDGILRGLLGQGDSYAKLGNAALASAAYLGAEAELEAAQREVPFLFRDEYLSARDESVRRLVEVFVERGETRRAYDTVRRAQRRALSGIARARQLAQLSARQRRTWQAAVSAYLNARRELDEASKNDWALASDELQQLLRVRESKRETARDALDSALAELDVRFESQCSSEEPAQAIAPVSDDENLASLVFFKGFDHVLLFGARGDRIQVTRFHFTGRLSPEQERSLLEPLAETLRRARLVSVSLPPELADLDIYTLLFQGAPLLAHSPVAFSLDVSSGIPIALERSRSEIGIVTDPLRDLPFARDEEKILSDFLAAERIRTLSGSDASRERVIPMLEESFLFHYAGHAQVDPDKVEAGLLLAAGSRLEPEDVLALSRAAPYVILSACEAGKTPHFGSGLGFGLAHALLLVGTRALLASVAPVPDHESLKFQRLVYQELVAAGIRQLTPLDFADAVRKAQLSAHSQGLSVWSSYRVFMP